MYALCSVCTNFMWQYWWRNFCSEILRVSAMSPQGFCDLDRLQRGSPTPGPMISSEMMSINRGLSFNGWNGLLREVIMSMHIPYLNFTFVCILICMPFLFWQCFPWKIYAYKCGWTIPAHCVEMPVRRGVDTIICIQCHLQPLTKAKSLAIEWGSRSSSNIE